MYLSKYSKDAKVHRISIAVSPHFRNRKMVLYVLSSDLHESTYELTCYYSEKGVSSNPCSCLLHQTRTRKCFQYFNSP